MILDYSDDETDSVEWIKDTTSNKNSLIDVFDCGCCDDCLCDYMMDCNNCKCSCCSNINEDSDNLEEKKEIDELKSLINGFTK